MTREEAKTILKNAAWLGTHEDRDKVEQAVEMAIQALENHDTFMKYAYSQGKHDALSQEPCDDLISRQAVKELIKSGVSTDTYDDVEQVCKWIDALPSVTQKSGKWIGVNPMVDTLMCSECGENIISADFKSNYCPNCGAKMVEPQESEDKE